MRILLLTHAFNSLTQRLGAELRQRGHEISVEFDISDSVTEEAAALFAPDLLVAPYLRRGITSCTNHRCRGRRGIWRHRDPLIRVYP